MAKDDEPVDDLHSVTWAPVADVPAEAAVPRLDYGDIAQRAEDAASRAEDAASRTADIAPRAADGAQQAEMDDVTDVSLDEPIELVDAPIQIREPFSRSEKRRNQRRMPT